MAPFLYLVFSSFYYLRGFLSTIVLHIGSSRSRSCFIFNLVVGWARSSRSKSCQFVDSDGGWGVTVFKLRECCMDLK